jgi:major membrane immunogen (membrane-anchored lipoprotein)
MLLLGTILLSLVLIGCGGSEESAAPAETADSSAPAESSSDSTGQYEDGVYFAEEDGFSERTGWKYIVILEVDGGEIVSATWEGANRDGGTSKVTRSRSGEYGMVENGGAIAPWFEQAAAAEAYLLETQDPTAIEYTTEEGHTDAISGATIHVVEFFTLAEEALANGPVGYGMWQDGQYHAEEPEFGRTGWKYMVDLTVIGGRIVAANWNGIHEEGGTDKKTRSMDGEYGMVENGGAIAPWFEQARAAEAYLLETQDPTAIEYTTEEGHTDAISGATIHVVEFFSLAEEALEGARR